MINSYIKEIERKYNASLRYNYLSNIDIYLSEGFTLRDIEFRKTEYLFKIYISGEAVNWIVGYCHEFGEISVYKENIAITIIEDQNRKDFLATLNEIKTFLENKLNKPIKVTE